MVSRAERCPHPVLGCIWETSCGEDHVSSNLVWHTHWGGELDVPRVRMYDLLLATSAWLLRAILSDATGWKLDSAVGAGHVIMTLPIIRYWETREIQGLRILGCWHWGMTDAKVKVLLADGARVSMVQFLLNGITASLKEVHELMDHSCCKGQGKARPSWEEGGKMYPLQGDLMSLCPSPSEPYLSEGNPPTFWISLKSCYPALLQVFIHLVVRAASHIAMSWRTVTLLPFFRRRQ